MKKIKKMALIGLTCMTMLFGLAACGEKKDTGVTAGGADTDSVQAGGAEAGGQIVFGTNAEFPPFEFVGGQGVIGQYDGIDMAIAKQIGTDIGKEATINNMEFDSLLLALQNGQVDAVIAGMTVTDEREEAVDFSIPYYSATQVMIVKQSQRLLIWLTRRLLLSRDIQVRQLFRNLDISMSHLRRVLKLLWSLQTVSVM